MPPVVLCRVAYGPVCILPPAGRIARWVVGIIGAGSGMLISVRHKAGEGGSFDQSYNHPLGPEATAVDAIVDMYLLSFCDTVILTRETKFAYFIRYIMQKDHALFIDWKEFFNQLSPASPAQESVKNW